MEHPIVSERTIKWSNYTIALFITILIFATALYASNYFNSRRIADIRATQDDISTDILSLETQFDLMGEYSCKGVTENTTLPSEMRTLAAKLSYLEAQGRNANEQEVTRLKRLYSLLEIKDYLIMKDIARRCDLKPVFILYFYSNEGDCKDCENQGYVLTSLAEQYPQLRIYSFDYNLAVPALKTLVTIDGIKKPLPALYMNGEVYNGFKKVDDIEALLPQLKTLQKTTASSTAAKLKKSILK